MMREADKDRVLVLNDMIVEITIKRASGDFFDGFKGTVQKLHYTRRFRNNGARTYAIDLRAWPDGWDNE